LLYDDLSRGGQHAHGTHMHGARDDHATRSNADPTQASNLEDQFSIFL
jgi:hypothetical protein